MLSYSPLKNGRARANRCLCLGSSEGLIILKEFRLPTFRELLILVEPAAVPSLTQLQLPLSRPQILQDLVVVLFEGADVSIQEG